jgi:hypothetical protein
MNSKRVRGAIAAAMRNLEELTPSVLRSQVLEHAEGEIAELLIQSGMFEGRLQESLARDPFAVVVQSPTVQTAFVENAQSWSFLAPASWHPNSGEVWDWLVSERFAGFRAEWHMTPTSSVSVLHHYSTLCPPTSFEGFSLPASAPEESASTLSIFSLGGDAVTFEDLAWAA